MERTEKAFYIWVIIISVIVSFLYVTIDYYYANKNLISKEDYIPTIRIIEE